MIQLGLVKRTSGAVSVLANAVGRAWMLAANIIMFPIYLKMLGSESFGIVALLVAVTSIVALFDFGLSPVFARELNNQARTARDKLNLLSTAEYVYLGIVIVIFSVVWLSPDLWLAGVVKKGMGEPSEIAPTLRLVLAVALAQLIFNFYIAAVSGVERQLQSNLIIVVTGLFRSLGVLLPLWLFPKVEVFLWWQFTVTVSGALLARYLLQLTIRSIDLRAVGRFCWYELRTTFPIARTSFLLASAATLNVSVDRIFVSSLQGLAQVGEYTIVATFAQLILFASLPITITATPRMVRAITKGDKEGFEFLVTVARTAVGVATAISTTVLFRHGSQIIEFWTDGAVSAQQINGYLGWLLLGSAALALSGIWHCIASANQDYSFGKVYVYSVLVVVPLYGFSVSSYGVQGAAIAWGVTQLVVMLAYRYWVGRRLLSGNNRLATPWIGMVSGVLAALLAGWIFGFVELQSVNLSSMVFIILAESALGVMFTALILVVVVRHFDPGDGLVIMIQKQLLNFLRNPTK